MGGPWELMGSLLSALNDVLPLPICGNDVLFSVSLAGALFALSPVLGALLVALIRKGTGNNYGGAPIGAFAGVGLLLFLLLPWLGFLGTSTALDRADRGLTSGLSAGTRSDLQSGSCFVDDQSNWLGDGPNVYEAVVHPTSGLLMFGIAFGVLVLLPAFGWLCAVLLGRIAFRRGPKWPGMLLWIPYLLMVLTTAPLNAHVVAQLWAGFVPVLLLGMLPVLIVGAPPWSVIRNSEQRRDRRQQDDEQPPARPPQQLPPPERPREPAPREHPPTKVAPVAEQAPLADTPGPLPFAAAGVLPGRDQPTAGNGRFRRVRRLGAGGFGTVWLAVDTQLDRTVAVKFAHAPDAETEQRMLREARALAAVRHPNCVHVYDVVSEPDGLGIVMEYIDGPALSEAVRGGGRLADVAAGRLWATMAGALNAAHEKGVLHRDVKPSNVIIDPAGAAHLIDFGIARSEGDLTLTATGMMMGTPDFLAPESAAGETATPASDAWQLAATVSYALCGAPPRGSYPDAMAAFRAAAQGTGNTKLPHQSAHLRLLEASLHPDPGRRPTLAVVRREVAGWLSRSGHGEDGPVLPVQTPSKQSTRPVL